jgi:sulfur transfer protein SufE
MEQTIDVVNASDFFSAIKLGDVESEMFLDTVGFRYELNGLIYYDAVSDSDFLNGVITLLMNILSEDTSDNIINAELKFIDQIGLRSYSDQTHLNDIEKIIEQIKLHALEFQNKHK